MTRVRGYNVHIVDVAGVRVATKVSEGFYGVTLFLRYQEIQNAVLFVKQLCEH
jgi:tRNA U34 5-carboxymethylaminomethyl modifying GTPase MnmE/TrmE